MRKIAILVLAAATAMVLAVGSGSAVASGHNQKACESTTPPGVWVNDQGMKTCIREETGKNDNFQCTEETAGQGNLGNKTQGPFEEEENTGSGKCPPGQYK